ncbi:MAG: hypothetical protein QXI18_01645 [Nitrososphaerota archaeon]
MVVKVRHPRKEAREALLQRALEVVREAGSPVSTDFVAFHLKIPWHSAKALLLELAARGKLDAINTTRGLIFASPEWVENTLRKAGKEVKVKNVVEG